MRRISAIVLALVLSGCGASAPPIVESPSVSPSASPSASPSPVRADSLIGKNDAEGKTTVTVDVPDLPECKIKHTSVTIEVFEKCLIEELTPIQVMNTIGFKGDLVSESGDVQIRQWAGGDGKYITVTFIKGHLKSKSQVGL